MAKKTKAGRMKVVLATALLFAPALLLILISTRGCEHKFKVLDDYGKIAEYSFTDARGKKYTSSDFKDKIVLITTLQPSCPGKCEISFWHLKKHIYETVYTNKKKLGDVRIISFVTDGEGNPVDDVSQVASMVKDQVKDYNPDIWIIASGSSKKLYDIEHNKQNLLKVGEEDFGGENGFQKLMLLVDKNNHLRMALSGENEGMVRRMKEHVALLMKQYDKEAAKKK